MSLMLTLTAHINQELCRFQERSPHGDKLVEVDRMSSPGLVNDLDWHARGVSLMGFKSSGPDLRPSPG